jgi:hypothetical protein
MKTRLSLLLTVLLCVAFAASAFAQTAGAEQHLQNYLTRYPRLQAHPKLVDSPTWRKNHPEAWEWFQSHPGALKQMRRGGGFEPNGTWHNSNWWYQNNPNWVYQNHRDWIQQNPGWRQQGDWYEGKWHNRQWYEQHQGEWARQHHPEWGKFNPPPQGKALGHYKHEAHEQYRPNYGKPHGEHHAASGEYHGKHHGEHRGAQGEHHGEHHEERH